MSIAVTTREQWGCPPTPVRYDVDPRGMTIHYPGPGRFRFADHKGCMAQVKAWDAQHRASGSIMLEYGGIVCQHGHYLEGRGRWGRLVARPGSNGTAAANSVRLSVQLMVGTLDSPPTDQELRWLAEVVAQARAQGCGLVVDGHRDWYATACPGDPLYRALPTIARYASTAPIPAPPTDPGGDDLDATQDLRLAQAWDSVTPGVEGQKTAGALYTLVADLSVKMDALADLSVKVDALTAKVDALTAPTQPPVEPPPFG